jgi:hypothetical protein
MIMSSALLRLGGPSLLALATLAACAPGTVEPAGPGGGGDGDACVPDSWTVTRDLTLRASCSPYTPDGDIVVKGGATLEIEAGVEVQFAEGAGLFVGTEGAGRLVADGTTSDPVVLSGVSGAQWVGVAFGPQTLPSALVEDVTIRGAGGEPAEGSFAARGCLTHGASTGYVSVRRATFDDCAQAGVSASTSSAIFAVFEDNAFANSAVGIESHPSVAITLGTDHSFDAVDANRLLGGTIDTTTVIPAFEIPWAVEGSLSVGGADSPFLILDAGTELRFDEGAAIEVGTLGEGGLMARGADGASIKLSPPGTPGNLGGPGSWAGIVFGPFTAVGSVLEHVELAGGGGRSAPGVDGCITIDSATPGAVGIVDTTLEGCAGFEGVHVEGAWYGLTLSASAAGSIGDGNSFDGLSEGSNRITGGSVTYPMTWRAQEVPWRIEDVIEIGGADAPGLLTLDAGIELLFEDDAWLSVGGTLEGGLMAIGAEGREVVLKSAAETPSAGDWVGIVFGPAVMLGSRLEHVDISHAGRAETAATRGCVTVQSMDSWRVSVENSTFDNCSQSAVAATMPGVSFAAFDHNTLSNSDAGLWLAPSAVGSIGMNNSYDNTPANRLAGGSVSESAIWVSQGVPWDVAGNLEVGGANSPYLNLWAGVHLRFEEGGWLRTGGVMPGALVVEGLANDNVIFESSTATTSGSWVGLVFGQQTLAGSSIDEATIRHAGEEIAAVTQGAVSLQMTASNLSVTNTTFRNNAQADVFIDCDSTPNLADNDYSNVGEVNEADCPVIP